MTSDKIQVANLKDALKDLNIHLSPEELQQVEEALNVDGKYNHCHPVCPNSLALLIPIIKLSRIHLFVWAFETVFLYGELELCIPGYLKLLILLLQPLEPWDNKCTVLLWLIEHLKYV